LHILEKPPGSGLKTHYTITHARRRGAKVIAQQKANMKHLGLHNEQIERAIQPSLCFLDQLQEEIEVYEKLHRGDFDPINCFRNK